MDCNKYKHGEMGPLGKLIKNIIIQNEDFIVYIDHDETIEWSTESGYSGFDENFGSVQNQVSFWESVCNKLFLRKDAYVEIRNITKMNALENQRKMCENNLHPALLHLPDPINILS